ncbi:MAG: hypothetical protein ABIS01_06065 [Ferruginibacter sp.]
MVNGQSSLVYRQSSPHSSRTSIHSSLTSHIHPFYFAGFFSGSIFASGMALLDLDKIIIKRTILGIRCTSCGGNLVIARKKSIVCRFINLVSFGTIKSKNYECENCKKKHLLI